MSKKAQMPTLARQQSFADNGKSISRLMIIWEFVLRQKNISMKTNSQRLQEFITAVAYMTAYDDIKILNLKVLN